MNIKQLKITRRNLNAYANALETDFIQKKKVISELLVFHAKLCNSDKFDAFNLQRAHESIMDAMYELNACETEYKKIYIENKICNAFCDFVEYARVNYGTYAEEKIQELTQICSALTDRNEVLIFWSYCE